jgi:hypothetical protein
MSLRLSDPTYKETIGKAAAALVGRGFEPQVIEDLAAKLDLFRAMVGMASKKNWPDWIIANYVFGDQPGKSAPDLSRKKLGKVPLSAHDASALAQVLNFFASHAPEQLTTYQSAVFDAPAIEFITSKSPTNSSLRAFDLTRPLLGFAEKLVSMLETQDVDRDIIHDRAMSHLNALRSRADVKVPVVIERLRDRQKTLTRFGDAQKGPEEPPFNWEPFPIQPNDTPQVYLPIVFQMEVELWAVTVRDPRPPSAYARRGNHCWDEPWERLVRWIVPSKAVARGETPSVGYGAIVELPGEYSLYLLACDLSESAKLRGLLGLENRMLAGGASVSMTGFHRLLALAIDDREKSIGFRCFARRYRVVGG